MKMKRRVFSKTGGLTVILSFILTLNVVQPLFAGTKTKETPVGKEGPFLIEWVTNFFSQFEGHQIARNEAPAPNAQDARENAERTTAEDQKVISI